MPHTINIGLFIIFMALQWVDWTTTKKLLDSGGRELNPVLNWLFKLSPLDQIRTLAIVKIVMVFLAVWMMYLFSPLAYAIACLIYALTGLWNWHQINKR